MSNHSYDVDVYNSVLQSELNKLYVIGVLLLIVLIALIVYSIVEIRENRTKKFPYIQLVFSVILSVFLMWSFRLSIIAYSKDISEEAYIQYEGPANIIKRRIFVIGDMPTSYNEYVISFDNNGEHVELTTNKNYGLEGEIENLYIVYAQNSGEILEFIE